MNTDRQLEINEARHHAADARYLDKLDAAMVAGEVLIGLTYKEGKSVSYINLRDARGRMNGKIVTGTGADMVAFIVRNPRYIAFA